MKKRRRYKVIEVGVLENPDPSFVSLVNRGANNTPFRTLKALDKEEVLEQEEKDRIQKELDKTDIEKSDGKGRHGYIRKIMFSRDSFNSKASVEDWMASKNFEDFEVLDSGDGGGFVVEGDSDLSDVRAIQKEKGVTLFIGRANAVKRYNLQEPARKRKKEISIKGFGEEVHKIDIFALFESGSSDLREILGDADDGVPMGTEELMIAFHTALGNALGDRDFEAVRQASTDFAEILIALATLMGNVAKSDEEREAVKDYFDMAFKTTVTNTIDMDKDTEKAVEEQSEEEAVKSAEESQEEVSKAEENENAEEAVKEESAEEAVKEEAEESEEAQKEEDSEPTLKDLANLITSAQKSNEDKFESLKETVEELKEKSEKADERIEEIEKARQSRKSEDIEETVKEEKETVKAADDPLRRSHFGFMGARKNDTQGRSSFRF